MAAEDGEEWVAGDEDGWLGGQGTQGLEGRVSGWDFISGEREAAAQDTPHSSGQFFPSGCSPQPSLSLFSPRLCSGFKPKLSVSSTCWSPSQPLPQGS